MSNHQHSQQGSEEDILTPVEAAEMLRIPLRTLDAWRYRRIGPTYSKVGRHVRYRRSEILRFLSDAEVGS